MSNGKLFSSMVRLYHVVYDHESNSKDTGQYAKLFAKGDIGASNKAGLYQLADEMADSLSSLTNLELAEHISTNLGLTDEAAETAINYLVDKFEEKPDNRGSVVYNTVELFSTLTNNPVFGALARAFNQLTDDFAQSIMPENGDVTSLIISILNSGYELDTDLTYLLENLLEEYSTEGSDDAPDNGQGQGHESHGAGHGYGLAKHGSDLPPSDDDSDDDSDDGQGQGHESHGAGHGYGHAQHGDDLSPDELIILINSLLDTELNDDLSSLLANLSHELSQGDAIENNETETELIGVIDQGVTPLI